MSDEGRHAANVDILPSGTEDKAARLQMTFNPSGQLNIQKNKNPFVGEKKKNKKMPEIKISMQTGETFSALLEFDF